MRLCMVIRFQVQYVFRKIVFFFSSDQEHNKMEILDPLEALFHFILWHFVCMHIVSKLKYQLNSSRNLKVGKQLLLAPWLDKFFSWMDILIKGEYCFSQTFAAVVIWQMFVKRYSPISNNNYCITIIVANYYSKQEYIVEPIPIHLEFARAICCGFIVFTKGVVFIFEL